MNQRRLAIIALAIAPALAMAQELSGVVTHVEDGDTLTLSVGGDRYIVRLGGIDAPETWHARRDPKCLRPGQPGGEKAKQALAALALNKPARAVCDGHTYERIACRVSVDGRDVAEQLARQGWAWAEPRYGRAKDHELVRQARSESIGLWASKTAMEPWRFRTVCWKQGDCSRAESCVIGTGSSIEPTGAYNPIGSLIRGLGRAIGLDHK